MVAMPVKYTDHSPTVKLAIKNATAEALAATAKQIEAEAKVYIFNINQQVDTGFMGNSVYSVSQSYNSYGQTRKSGAYANQQGQSVKRVIEPERNLTSDAGAAVVVGAEYAAQQEIKKSFLYAAAEKVAPMVEGTLDGVFKQFVHD
jgi:hypothetical protein